MTAAKPFVAAPFLWALTCAAIAAPATASETTDRLATHLGAKHGPFLVDGDGRALYLFTSDTQGQKGRPAKSACTQDACLSAWPPVEGSPGITAGEGVKAEAISSIQRQDGGSQLTYNGWPLYRYVGDRGQGAATGHDLKSFKGEWYLVSPQGEKATKGTAARAEVKRIEELFAKAGLKGPECILHDADRDVYLVSNITGGMRKKDNNGFIARLNPADGSVDRKWISADSPGVTLHSPKGMLLNGNYLYVADIDRLRVFDAATGKPEGSLKIKGATFLNAITLGQDGLLYVTDTGTKGAPGAVYRVDGQGQVKAIAQGFDLKRPNGIVTDKAGNLEIVTFGADMLYTMTPDGSIAQRTTLPSGQLDGLKIAPDGRRLAASWKGQDILAVDGQGKPTVVLAEVESPAAFEIDRKRGLLLVPQVRHDQVAVAPLE